MKHRVLIIDDEPSITRSLSRVLADRNCVVETAASGEEGVSKMEAMRPHIVLLDLRLPDASGFDLIPRLHKIESAAQIIVITAFGDTKVAVKAIKLGASDFLRKPYYLDELVLAIETAGRAFARDTQLSVYRRKDRGSYNPDEICWRCDAMARVWDLVRKVSRSDATSVLITGESGTGKELVARGIHFEGARRRAPFMDVNCSSFQETLLENELFGHERGAFTGATYLKRGLVELSEGGTLFLDEIGELSAPVQVKLLRFLQEHEFQRLGGNQTLSTDVRVISATNRDLEQRVKEGAFREDLFYRLNVVMISIPPLRERKEDIPALIDYFVKRYADENEKRIKGLSSEAQDVLLKYDYPGNVRELENIIERAVVVAREEMIFEEDLPFRNRPATVPEFRQGEEGMLRGSVEELEKRLIVEAMEKAGDHQSRAADLLGISERMLRYKLKKYGLKAS